METEKTSMTEPPKFKFLDDNCSDCDLTEGKTHQRIADQLHDLIVSGPPDGMTIGLEGDWGSGKSTVIELLRQRLERENKSRTIFFYIDAWEHEGDPLRRAFLEALIDRIEESHAEKQHELCSETRKELRKIRDKVSVKQSATRLTGLGITVTAAGLLVPIGAELVSTFASQVTLRNTGKPCWGFIAGVALCLAPAIAFGIAKGVQKVFDRSGKQSAAIFSTEKSMDISLENERTSLEFYRYFNEILCAIKPDFDQIVMVIDNLDRIGQEDALRIWSTLQTFVQRKNPLSEPKAGIPKWIVVPYAEEGLGRVWNDELGDTNVSRESKKEEGEEEDRGMFELNGESRGAKRLASFMDKTFDLRIHVPSMLLGDWQAFARDCIQKVEPKFPPDDIETILNTLVWTRKCLEDAPSPRQIKLYVNHVALLCQLHRERVSLDAICFYVITKYLDEGLTDEDIKKALLSGGIDDRSLPPYSGPLASEMAAIVFNTDKTRAMQLLLERTLRKELDARDIDALQTSKKRFEDVFDDVIGHILSHAPSRDFSGFLALIQRACSGMSERLCKFAFQRMKTEREAITRNISLLGHANVLALIEFANRDQDLSMEFAKEYISERIFKFSNSDYHFNDIVAEIHEISLGKFLLQKLEEVKNATKQDVQIPYQELIDGKFVFDKLNREEMVQFFAYISDLDAADNHLAEILASPPKQWPKRMSEWFGALTAKGMTKVDKILDGLAEVFKMQSKTLVSSDTGAAFWGMMVAMESIPRDIRPVARIKTQMQEVCDQIPMPQGFHSKLCFMLAKYLEFGSESPQAWEQQLGAKTYHYHHFWERNDDSIGRDIHGCISLSGEYEWLANQARFPEKRLVGNIVKAALAAQDSNLFKVSQPFLFLKAIWPMVPADMHGALIKRFAEDEARLRNLGEPKGGTLTADPELCRELLDHCSVPTACPSPTYQTLVKKCTEELHKFTKNQWEQALDEDKVCQLLAFLAEKGVEIKLENPFCATFESLVLETLESPYGSNWDCEVWVTLYRAMAPTFQRPFASKVGSQLLKYKLEIDDDDLRKFLFDFPDYSDWVADARAEILEAITHLAERGNLEALSDFTGLLKRHRKAIVYWEDLNQILNPYLAKVPDEADD